ncbi:helix-turn-helix domain-containing protein [Butyrivibrio sp. AE3004]|uniref:helix-turn-helix domain-containing protein n=1 Tax=Butyrivibrio sp. AE3004 TaxID=1506994 RepID=UPI0018CC3466|nr:helix-turn-helix domain-containing protein [Butyrivibrio sp. AE3004]
MSDINMEEKKFLTIKDVSEVLHLGYNKTRKLFHLAGFPSIKLGGVYLIEEKDLFTYLDKHKGSQINV